MSGNNLQQRPDENPQPHRRRPRYSGTHPKNFDERYKEHNPNEFPEMQEHVRAQGRTPAGTHIPVLLSEVLAAFNPKPGDIVADCTLGYGGHALEFLRHIAPTGRLIGLDVDAAQCKRTHDRLASALALPETQNISAGPSDHASIHIHRSHFAGLGKVLAREGIPSCDFIFADLGVSSMQIDDPARGFSYKHDGPLDMRMDDRLVRTAADLLVTMSAEDLTVALQDLADEPDAARIADLIVRRRAVRPLTRTQQVVDLVFEAKRMTRRAWRDRPPEKRSQLHPAARTFQALRILVNDEMSGLAQFLRVIPHCLSPGGRVGIISFHSGEDRLVEDAFQNGLTTGVFVAISNEPVRPTPSEIVANPRSRSAVLRWAAKAAN